jgi:hypothetical protein
VNKELPKLSNKPKKRIYLRIRQKLILRMAVYCTLVTFVTVSGFLIYSNLASPLSSKAAVAKYFSIANGEWSTFLWSEVSNAGPSCSCTPTCNLAIPALIRHKLTVSSCGSFAISGGVTVDINNGGNLRINCPFTLSGGSILNVANGDTLLIDGNTTVSGGSTINMNGYMVINGNLTLSGNSIICGGGQGYVINGSISGSGWCFTGTLPIELVSFKARKENDNAVKLDWVTASETNNDYFTVERSGDGIHFEKIINVAGAGNVTTTQYYSWVDRNPLSGNNFYRLRQTDYDGKNNVSPVVRVRISARESQITVFPNPARQNETISLKIPGDLKPTRFSIFNTAGRPVLEQNISPENYGEMPFTLSWENTLPPGTYIVCLYENDQLLAKNKLLVQ